MPPLTGLGFHYPLLYYKYGAPTALKALFPKNFIGIPLKMARCANVGVDSTENSKEPIFNNGCSILEKQNMPHTTNALMSRPHRFT